MAHFTYWKISEGRRNFVCRAKNYFVEIKITIHQEVLRN